MTFYSTVCNSKCSALRKGSCWERLMMPTVFWQQHTNIQRHDQYQRMHTSWPLWMVKIKSWNLSHYRKRIFPLFPSVHPLSNCTYPIVPFPDIGGLGGFWVGGVVRGSPPIFIFWVLTCMKERGEKRPSLSSGSRGETLRCLWQLTLSKGRFKQTKKNWEAMRFICNFHSARSQELCSKDSLLHRF